MLSELVEKYRKYKDDKNVLIYQMGKVGSTAFEKSIENSIHFHSLYRHEPCKIHTKQQNSSFNFRIRRIVIDYIRRFSIRTRKEIKIITLVRDPISRDVSMFFQNLQHWLYDYSSDVNMSFRDEKENFLIDAFYSSYDIEYGLSWFDEEFKKFTGIDIYNYRFDKVNGYAKINCGKFKILVLRMNEINNNKEVISDFIGKEFNLSKANSGNEKWYGPLYKDFTNSFEPTKDYKRNVENSKLYKHFIGDK